MALLAVGKPSSIGLFSGFVPQRTEPPYILVYFAFERFPDAPGNNLDGNARAMTMRAIVHCVGGNQDAAEAVADHVEGAVLNKTLEVNGWSTGKVRQDSALNPVRDESTGPVVMDAVQTYRVASHPALILAG